VAHHLGPIHARHADIEEEQVVAALLEARQGLLARAGLIDVVPPQAEQVTQAAADGRLIVHNEQSRPVSVGGLG